MALAGNGQSGQGLLRLVQDERNVIINVPESKYFSELFGCVAWSFEFE